MSERVVVHEFRESSPQQGEAVLRTQEEIQAELKARYQAQLAATIRDTHYNMILNWALEIARGGREISVEDTGLFLDEHLEAAQSLTESCLADISRYQELVEKIKPEGEIRSELDVQERLFNRDAIRGKLYDHYYPTMRVLMPAA